MFMSLRRVAVTGIGLVTPLGLNAKHTWSRLSRSECGIQSLVGSDGGAFDNLPSTIAGRVEGFDAAKWVRLLL